MMGWWIFLGVLVLIFLLPLGVRILYDHAGVRIVVLAGPARITVFPMKKKEPKQDKQEKQQEEPKPEPEPVPQEKPAEPEEKKKQPVPLPEAPKPPKAPGDEEPGGSILDFLPLVELALKFVGEFFHKTLHIDVLYLKLTMAGGDPADLAINYGNTWAALGNLWPYIDRMFTIKKRDIQVQCDFEGSETLVNARVDITITLARIFGLVLGYGFRILFKLLQILWARDREAKAAKKAKAAKNEKSAETK